VLFALSAHLIWAPLLFRIFTPEILIADSAAVQMMLGLLRPDISVIGTTFSAGNGHTVTLVGACSSFQNISIASLAAVSVTMLVRPYWVRRDFLWLLAICVTMVAINVVRIGVLAWSFENYLYWHNGVGSQLLALFQTIIVAGMSYLGARSGVSARE